MPHENQGDVPAPLPNIIFEMKFGPLGQKPIFLVTAKMAAESREQSFDCEEKGCNTNFYGPCDMSGCGCTKAFCREHLANHGDTRSPSASRTATNVVPVRVCCECVFFLHVPLFLLSHPRSSLSPLPGLFPFPITLSE